MEYGPAKRRAARLVACHSVRPADLPGNDELEDEVRSYLSLFHADTQPPSWPRCGKWRWTG
jgi:hypothetical protein